MSNAFMGQRQQASPMGYGGYSGGYDPFGGGGYGTQFGGYDMGGGGEGDFGGYGGGMRAPAYEPTINDEFSRYFSQQYYGGPAFDPFAATSFFGGGGYGGGFGGGGGRRGGGMGGRMRRRRQMFEDLFQPEQPPQPQPEMGLQPGRMPPPLPYEPESQRPTIPNQEPPGGQPMPIGGGAYQPGGGGQRIEMGPVTPQPDFMMRPAVMPQPYMGTDVDSIMPVQMQDTPVQSAPAYAPAPYIPPAPTYTEPMQYTPPAPSYAEPIQYIPPAPTYMEPEQYIPLNIAPRFSPFARSSREMLELDF